MTGVQTCALPIFIHSGAAAHEPAQTANTTVKQIGDALMTKYVLPLEVVGLLLTAALIGAVILALREEGKPK